MKLMRILSAIIIVIILLASTVFVFGYKSDVEYSRTKSALYTYDIEEVWDILTSIENYQIKKNDLERIEIIDGQYGKIFSWAEIYPNKTMEYSIIESEPYFYSVEVTEDDFYQGTLDYFLEPDGDRTKLTIRERSENNNIWKRGLDTIFGRDHYIDAEFKWIRVSLLNNLIYQL